MTSPIKDKIAIIGVGSTGFSRSAERSQLALALDASIRAIADAGLTKSDINGVCGTTRPLVDAMISSLGLPEVSYFGNQAPTFVFTLLAGMQAIFAGTCDTVLAYNSVYRVPANSRTAAGDPFRRHLAFGGAPLSERTRIEPEDLTGTLAYAAWASRYLFETKMNRERLGLVAINGRTNAGKNPLAVKREPLTLEEYMSARIVRKPLCLYDMDVPVDGADAFVLTSVERAKSLKTSYVIIHAAAAAAKAPTEEAQIGSLRDHAQHTLVRQLKERSDLWLDDIDLYFPYDGFSSIAVQWLESVGWCGFGEAGDFLIDNWDESRQRIMIGGRIPVNTHGGQLSEGATQGSGHVREAVLQLRGDAGDRQVPSAKSALLTIGGMFHNTQGLVLRAGAADSV
jgi:acetyl-CoA acetyltransferase